MSCRIIAEIPHWRHFVPIRFLCFSFSIKPSSHWFSRLSTTHSSIRELETPKRRRWSGSSPSFIGKVMRIQKKAKRNGLERPGSPPALTMHERLLWKDLEDMVTCSNKELASQLYVKHVMSPLLGSHFVDAGMRVQASREFLETVEKNVNSQRPASRVDAAKVDTECDYVLVMSDHSLFPDGVQEGETCISVEIKPKCGFLPASEYIDEGNAIKRRITRFRMHQALKLHDGEVSQYSNYDPLDLFSGLKDRIHKAIKDLFTTPQNNFRVFVNGSLIFGGLGGGAESTNLETGDKFETALKDVIQGGDGTRTVNFLHLVAETVYRSGVIDQLLEIQKLDYLDIDGAIHAYYDIMSEPCMVCTELGKDKASNRYSSLHSLPLDESLKIVKQFLISASAKDCSLMFSFRPRKDGSTGSPYNNVYLESTNQFYDYKVYFIDLDLKSLKKLEEYYELDKKIISYDVMEDMLYFKNSDLSVYHKHLAVLGNVTICGHLAFVMWNIKAVTWLYHVMYKELQLFIENYSVSGASLFKVQEKVTGEADPVKIIHKVRKFRRSASVVSIGPPKPEEKKDEKKDSHGLVPYIPKTCQDVCLVCGCRRWL
ncbi:hypothetical protein ACLB2K_018420 [Fragaria x ananassa]